MLARSATAILLILTVSAGGFAQTAISDVPDLIRDEAFRRSEVMKIAETLTDRYSPRLTGTPQVVAAQRWALGKLADYGLSGGHLEEWDFGSPGWQNMRLQIRAVAPFVDNLTAEAIAWTPSTRGTVTASVVNIVPPVPATRETLTRFLETYRTSVRGKIVLVGSGFRPAPSSDMGVKRLTDEETKRIFAPERPVTRTSMPSDSLTGAEVVAEVAGFLRRSGALAAVFDAREPNGLVRTIVNRSRRVADFPPAVVVRNEDFGRLVRIISAGTPVTLELRIDNRNFPEGKKQFNAIAEIPGSDKFSELVMLGAHIDAHHLATGATDNAAGVAVMIEAVRILKAIGAKPRRTVRIGLWSGEEQGVLGSQAYVETHFGSAESPKADFDRLNAYFNLDTGTGKIRGMRIFGPAEAGDALRTILEPFSDLGVAGASTYSNRTAPGSDHAAFSVNGLPGVYIDQDPIEYGRLTWHSSVDTFERLNEDDLKQAAAVVALAVFRVANREDRLPRFTAQTMPKREFTRTVR